MEATARPVLRPLTGLASHLAAARAPAQQQQQHHQQQQIRLQSTRPRTGRMLKIRPHESFLPSEASANHVIFNPPAAAPNVLNTPFKFLPPTDPRRRANLTSLLRTSVDLPTGARDPAAAAPALDAARQVPTPAYNVTREQVDDMRRLRAENPAKWSVAALADKFQCSKLFVMMCCKASAEHRAEEKKRLEAIKARWGPIRRNAREDRQKRRAMLLRGEL